MAKIYLILALIVQSSLTYAQSDDNGNKKPEISGREELKYVDAADDVVKDFHGAKVDWMDMFIMPGANLYPTSSAALMAQATNTNKTAEEQLEDIKEIANQISMAIQSEMANLLSFALSHSDKEFDDNSLRKKRSTETPMDSTQLVTRLLKHIKSNNEYQNIAIEKMMTAQEIADKYGIEFRPDTEILSDLAVAANEQAKEITSILKDACDAKNTTQIEFVPLEEQMCKIDQSPADNNTYYQYSVHEPQENIQQDFFQQNPFAPYEYAPQQIHQHHESHVHHDPAHYSYYYPYETQIVPPVPQYPPVTPKPNFYDSVMAVTPAPEYYQPYLIEPVVTTTTIIMPIEELIEPEPELVGEEYEETVSSKVFVDHEEPGAATVNHVMTYTLSEKAHFKTPEIEKLPEQMQYTFFLM